MKREVGIWIDHRQTVIVSVTDKGEETRLIKSAMEKHVRYSGAAQQDSAEDQRDTRFTGHLNKYYDHIPDGHFKIPHLWPGQNPPPRATAGQ